MLYVPPARERIAVVGLTHVTTEPLFSSSPGWLRRATAEAGHDEVVVVVVFFFVTSLGAAASETA